MSNLTIIAVLLKNMIPFITRFNRDINQKTTHLLGKIGEDNVSQYLNDKWIFLVLNDSFVSFPLFYLYLLAILISII